MALIFIRRNRAFALLLAAAAGACAACSSRDDGANDDAGSTRHDAGATANDAALFDAGDMSTGDAGWRNDGGRPSGDAHVDSDARRDGASEDPSGDAGSGDAGTAADAGVRADGGTTLEDAGSFLDASRDTDAGFVDACAAPLAALAVPSMVDGEFSTSGGGPRLVEGPACRHADGPVHVYTLHVAARRVYHFSTASSPNTDTVISVRSACGSVATERACSDDAPMLHRASELHVALDPGDYFVLVERIDVPATPYTYRLDVSMTDTDGGAFCGAPTTLVLGSTLTDNDIVGAGAASELCDTGASGGQLFYALELPVYSAATIRATARTGSLTPVLRVYESCGSTDCRFAHASSAGGSAELTVINGETHVRRFIISVSGASPSDTGSFDLRATSTGWPANYVPTELSASCDPAASLTPLASVTGDDTVSAVLALPATFSFYGTPMTHYGVSSNGLLQLFSSAVGATVLAAPSNVGIPNESAPNAIIAPFWDDLFPVAAPASDVRAGVVPTPGGGTHFTVQWTGWTVKETTERGARLTFQVKLFPGVGYVEVHYCELVADPTNPDRVTGSQATIGMENGAGESGNPRAFATPSAITSGSAIRWQPD